MDPVTPEAVGTPTPGEGTPPAPVVDSFEAKAREKGWKPKEEFDGDEVEWVSAEEFIKREPLFEKIRNQSKELKEMRRTIESMATHFKQAQKMAVDKALAELKTQRKEAIELGDVDAVERIDGKIAEKRIEADQVKPVHNIPEPIAKWVSENKWFNENMEMNDFATAFNENYLKRNPGKLEESLQKTREAVVRAFPDYFKNEKRSSPPSVEGTAEGAKGTAKYSIDRLSPDQKRVYKQLVTQFKQLTHEEYFKGLEEIGELR